MFIQGHEIDVEKIDRQGIEDLLFLLVYSLQNGRINCGTCRKRMDSYLKNFYKKYEKESENG